MKRRIIICLGLLLTLCLVGDLTAMFCLDRTNRQLGALAEFHRIQVLRTELVSSGLRIEADLLAYRAGRPHDPMRHRDSIGRFKESLNRCGTCHHPVALQTRLDKVRETFGSYVTAADRLFAADASVDRSMLEHDANRIADKLTRLSTAMADQAGDHRGARRADVLASVRRVWMVLLATLITVLAVGGAVAFHLKGRLTRPVEALLQGIERMRRGDRAYRFPADADEEFRTLGAAINDAYESLRNAQEGVFQAEKMAAVGKLAAGVAHEVGNPLASISSIAQMMRRQCESDEQAERLDLIMEQIERISRIVRELLTFSRPTPDQVRGRVQIPELLDRATTLMGYDKRARSIQVTRSIDRELRPVQGDIDKLLLAFTNLIINAFDALNAQPPSSPTLRISARQEGDYVAVRFEDNGPGMTPNQLASAFEPFFTTKEPGRGTGLGLWICYQVVQRHCGTIQIESRPAGSTIVCIRLPSEPADDPSPSGAAPGDVEQRPGSLAVQQTS